MVTNQLADLFGPAMLYAFTAGAVLCAFLLLVWGAYEGYTWIRRKVRYYKVRQLLEEMKGCSVVQPKLIARSRASSEQ